MTSERSLIENKKFDCSEIERAQAKIATRVCKTDQKHA